VAAHVQHRETVRRREGPRLVGEIKVLNQRRDKLVGGKTAEQAILRAA